MLKTGMRVFAKTGLLVVALALSSCAGNNDNAHTTATTIVPPPVRQQLRVSTRPASQLPPKLDGTNAARHDPDFNPQNPLLVFNLPNGKTFRQDEPVVIDFSLANAKLKGDGGEYRVRYIVDDEEMQWIDASEQVVLTGWTLGKHTIRLELVGPDGWPVANGISTRELTVVK
jgi:hypothetical protein